MRQPELFEGADFGKPRPSLARARELVAEVEALADVLDETWFDRCMAVNALARRLGAHSVARAVCWLLIPETLDRHGYDHMHYHADDVACRWLRRQEVGR